MCNFFSFITYKGEKYYFDHIQRREAPNLDHDSHTTIADFFLKSTIKEDRCNKYEYVNGKLEIDTIQDEDECFEDVKAWMDEFAKSEKFEKICIEVLNKFGYMLKYIKNQTKDMCLAAVNQDGNALQYVKKQTNEICLAAVNQDGYALQYVNKKFRHLFE
jgi:hypothetical protein